MNHTMVTWDREVVVGPAHLTCFCCLERDDGGPEVNLLSEKDILTKFYGKFSEK